MLAWILSIIGSDFWQFNLMELFATLAIIAGAIWTYTRWRKDKKRNLSLIKFPDNWSAQRNLDQNKFRLQGQIEVWLPHTSLYYICKVFSTDGRQLSIQFERPEHSYNPHRSEVWIINGTAPLESFPERIDVIEIDIEVGIDGGVIKKKSGKRIIPVTTIGPTQSTSSI